MCTHTHGRFKNPGMSFFGERPQNLGNWMNVQKYCQYLKGEKKLNYKLWLEIFYEHQFADGLISIYFADLVVSCLITQSVHANAIICV